MMEAPTRFYHRLLSQYSNAAGHNPKRLSDGQFSRFFSKKLDDPETRRILFDARQAMLFEDLEEAPPETIQAKLHAPFNQFYLEFTEPVAVGQQEPSQQDFLRAILFVGDYATMKIGEAEIPVSSVTFFLRNAEETQFIDRTFQWNLQSGFCFVRAIVARQDPDPSEIHESWKDEDIIIAGKPIAVPKGAEMEGESKGAYHLAVPPESPRYPLADNPERAALFPDRYIGWWERCVMDYSSLLSWMMTYLMAKGIRIVQEPVSRQQRRLSERKKIPLRPWHIVKVEPKFSNGRPQEDTGRHVGYRFDVIGHLRFGRHRRGDGGYNETIEWVPPHQRGLRNAVYVPKTYKVERGKTIAPAMRRYFGSESLSGADRDGSH